MAAPQRLSALEAAFLSLETGHVRFIVGSVLRLSRQLDLDRLRRHVDALLDDLPRYRQRITRVPLLHHPVWVDDPDFAIERQVLPAELPSETAEAGERRLERLAGRLLGRGVPMDRPPWRFYLVNDPVADRSAIIALVHHSLVDGIAGVHLIERLLRGVPDDATPQERARPARPHPHRPDPPPTRRDLLRGELRYRARGLAWLGRALPHASRELAPTLGALLAEGLHSAPDVGLNPHHTGADRAVAGCAVPLDDARAIKRAFHVSLNDVIVAVMAGALRQTLQRRGWAPPGGGRSVRAMVPVSTHPPGDEAVSGNRVALLLVPLPLEEADPGRRLQRVAAVTRELKHGATAAAGDYLVRLTDVTTPAALSAIFRVTLWRRAFNLILTNVPGPPWPLYLMGARLDSLIPIVNLWPGQGLGVALLSYDGRLFWGIDADRQVLPEVESLVGDIEGAFAELREVAAVRAGTAGVGR